MKTLITGVTGYLGYSLALALSENGVRVHSLVRNAQPKTAPEHENIRHFHGDLSNPGAIKKAMDGCEVVIHLAAHTNLNDPELDNFYKTNVEGTRNLLMAASKERVRHFIFISSLSVFGPSVPGYPINEDTPRTNGYANHYELTKALAEELVKEAGTQGLPFTILNISRVYGPGKLRYSNGMNRFMLKVINSKILFFPNRLGMKANYIYIGDVINQIHNVIHSNPQNEQYILGGYNHTYEEIIHEIKRHSNRDLRLVPVNYQVLKFLIGIKHFITRCSGIPSGVKPSVLDNLFTPREARIKKIRLAMNYTPTALDTGIKQTLNHIKNEIV